MRDRSRALGRRLLLLAIFFASGASGLVYELVWIRQFGTLFGSSVYSAALVTAIFMCGLGLGAWLAAGLADRSFRDDPVAPLRWYGRFELAIAALAAGVLLLMPQLAHISAGAASYHADEHGWLRLVASGSVVRYGCAAVLLLPVTMLMGGTLTLLVRFLITSDLSRAGRYVGVLYGVNTAGAALGCLATDTVLVPLLGLRATQAVALCGNLFAAAGAGWLARGARRGATAIPVFDAKLEARDARVAWLALALAGTGFASMAMQIVWFRQLIAVYGAYRPVFSILLTVILVGIWLGSWTAGRAAEKAPAAALYALSLAGFALFALIGIALPGHVSSDSAALPMHPDAGALPWLRVYGRLLRDVSWAVGPPAFFAGAAFPLANAIAQRRRDRIGRRVGVLYLASTLGGVLGSLAAGFLLLPRLGVQSTAAAVMVSVLAAWFALGRGVGWRTEHGSRLAQAASGVAILAALFAWSRLPGEYLIRRSLPLAADATGEASRTIARA